MFDIRYDFLKRSEYNDIWGFAHQQLVQADQFDFTLPKPYDDLELGPPGGTPVVNGASQTGRTLVTDGWPFATAVVSVGDFFQLSNHKKLYLITADGSSDGAGNLTLNFEPPLIESPLNNELLVLADIKARVYLADPNVIVTPERNTNLFLNVGFSFVEAP